MADISQTFPAGRALNQPVTRAEAKLALPALLYVISVATPVLMLVGPLYMSVTRMILLVLIVPLTANLFSGRYGKVLPIDYLFFAHIAWMTISMAIINPERVVENTGSAAIEFLGAYLVGRAFIRDRGDLIALVKLLAVISIVTLPLALLESQTGRPLILEMIKKLPSITSYANVNNEPRMGLERAQTLFIHPIHYGLFVSMNFALIYVGMARIMSAGQRLFYGIAIAICVFLSLSSGALLALLLQMFLIAWATIFHKVDKRWLMLFGFLAFCYVVIDLLSTRTPIRVFMSYATFSAHNAYWRSIIFEWGVMNIMGSVAEGIPSAKLFGIGLNDWIRPDFMHSGSMDNFWLVVAVRNGLPALAMLAGGYFWLLWRVGTRKIEGDPVLIDMRRAWMIAMVGVAFTLATVHIWGSIYSFVMFMTGAGVWFLTAEPEGADGPNDGAAPADPQVRGGTSYTRFPGGTVAAPDAGAERRALLSDAQQHAWTRARERTAPQYRPPGPRTSRLLRPDERGPR